MLRQSYGNKILDHFRTREADFLGAGGESRVYALDSERVLRVFSPGTNSEKVEQLKKFYDCLNPKELDFEIPRMSETGTIDDILYSVEPRIPGTNLTTVLADLSGEERRLALKNYVKAAASVRQLSFDADYYGEILVDRPIQSPSWSSFLNLRASHTLQHSERYLNDDVPNLASILKRWGESLQELSLPRRDLVHGDFFPGNVMADDTGVVTGVIDFSPMTVVGDRRMDLAGVVIFLEVTSAYRTEDTETVKKFVDEELGKDSKEFLDFYRLYYSLYFSGAREDDPNLYAWCVENLNQATSAAN